MPLTRFPRATENYKTGKDKSYKKNALARMFFCVRPEPH